MAAGRPSKEREILIYQALSMAYAEVKETNPSFPEIITKANEYDFIKLSKEGKIGDKTIFTSKNKDIIELRKLINGNKNEINKVLFKAPTELSNKIKELRSSLSANAILVREMESLENRLTNMKSIIEDRDNRITKKNEEILKLREEIKKKRKRYEYDN